MQTPQRAPFRKFNLSLFRAMDSATVLPNCVAIRMHQRESGGDALDGLRLNAKRDSPEQVNFAQDLFSITQKYEV